MHAQSFDLWLAVRVWQYRELEMAYMRSLAKFQQEHARHGSLKIEED